MTTYATAVEEVSSEKHLLFECEPAEELWDWTLTGGQSNTYEKSWSHLAATDIVSGGLYRLIISVEEDGTALTERASIALVESNAGSWYYDSSAEKIYVHTSGSADPDTVDMMAVIFRLYFSTSGKTLNTVSAGYESRDFDGTSDYYSLASDLDGNADAKVGTFSAWVRVDGGDATPRYMVSNTGNAFAPLLNSADKFQVVARNSDGTIILTYASSSADFTTSTTWRHVLASWDLAQGIVYLYVDDADSTPASGTATNDTIDYTKAAWTVAAHVTGASKFNGAISELFFTNEFLDISVDTNRRKFINADGEPVFLGADGSKPTGSQPAIFCPDGDASNNLGYGGNFTSQGNPLKAVGPVTRHDVHYEKRVLVGSRAAVAQKTADLIIGQQRTSRGEISLDNTDALFDKLSRSWNWKNKAARLRFGVDDIDFGEYQTTGRLVVDDIAPTEERFTLSLVSAIDAWRQRFPITPHFGAGLGEGVVGTRVPILIGSKSDIVPDLIDDEETTANEWIYQIADDTYQTLDAVSAVYAINKSTGARQTLTLTTHYTVNLTNCTITVNDAFDSGAEIEEKYEIRCDAVGQPAGASDTSTDYLKYPGEVAHWILNTFLDYADADLDVTSFDDADTDAPFPLAFWIKKETTVRAVLRGIERSVLGSIRAKNDGTVEFFLWDPGFQSSDVEELSDEDFASFRPDVKMETVYYQTSVLYDENPANPGSFEVQTVSDDATRYLNNSENALKVESYLTDSSDAQLLAQRINFLYRGINVEIDFAERGVRLMDHELYQRVKITKTRAPSTAGSYSVRLMELLEIEKDFITPTVSGRLGDLRGLADLIGQWTEATAPTWSAATDEEKAASGFWCDSNGLADAADPGSKDVSLWW